MADITDPFAWANLRDTPVEVEPIFEKLYRTGSFNCHAVVSKTRFERFVKEYRGYLIVGRGKIEYYVYLCGACKDHTIFDERKRHEGLVNLEEVGQTRQQYIDDLEDGIIRKRYCCDVCGLPCFYGRYVYDM